ncbi:hypothetical protein ACFSQJ_10970 [Croceitalea marina]|uniref:Lipoprotein n=1 Tax=Croceitalea marina TaxID=1775166 RepID=A0ABW5N0E4_9FLAO
MKRLNSLLFAIIVGLSFIFCDKENNINRIDLNLDDFEAISNRFPFEDLKPDSSVDYWELIYFIDNRAEVLLSSGVKCQGALEQEECIIRFDKFTNPSDGFAIDCLPDFCFYFVKYTLEETTTVATKTDEIIRFLGSVDSNADAILIAFSKGYKFSTENVEIGGIRETQFGYELLVTKLINTCNPLRIDRFHLQITTDAEVTVINSEVYDTSDDCI